MTDPASKPLLKEGSLIPKSDEVYYTWERVNFSVPLKDSEKKMIEDRQSHAEHSASPTKLMEEIIRKKSTGRIKVSKTD